MDKNDTVTGGSSWNLVEMTLNPSERACRCPVAAFQKMISGPLRYSEVRSGLLRGQEGSSEIAPRVLRRELKALAQAGLIARRDHGVVPPRVEYRLTKKGESFVPVIAAIRQWGSSHLAQGTEPESEASASPR